MRALSSTLGQVSVAWTVIEKGAATTLKFEWREHGGPTVTPPNRRRFGNPLLKAIFGEARIDYAPEGVSCAKPQLSFRSSGIAAGIMQSEFAAGSARCGCPRCSGHQSSERSSASPWD